MVSTTLITTVVLLLFLFPGMVFLRAISGSKRGYLDRDNIYYSLLWAAPLSIAAYVFLSCPVDRSFRLLNIDDRLSYSEIIQLCISKEHLVHNKVSWNGSEERPNTGLVTSKIIPTAIFFFCLTVATYFIASIFSFLILILRIDRFELFRFENNWFYLLSGRGEFLSEQFRKRKNKPLFYPNGFLVQVDLLCEIGNTVQLYSGIVTNYHLKKNILDTIEISSVIKKDWLPSSGGNPSVPPSSSAPQIPIITNTITATGAIKSNGSISAIGSITAGGDIEAKEDIIANQIITTGGSITAGRNITITSSASSIPPLNVPAASTSSAINQSNVIPGSVMIFKDEEIKNINVVYFKL